MTASSIVVLACLALFLLENVYWFRSIATASPAPSNPAYRIYVYQMHLAMIKRSVGLFAGFALIFIGTSVAFFTLEKDSKVEGGFRGFTARLSSASPGLIGMFLGTILIVFTIGSKDNFPPPSAAEPDQSTDISPRAGDPPL
jgi:hypothetical protein